MKEHSFFQTKKLGIKNEHSVSILQYKIKLGQAMLKSCKKEKITITQYGCLSLTCHRVYCRRACGHVDMGTCPHQVLAATLTLSQPGGTDYAHPILMSHNVLKATDAPAYHQLGEPEFCFLQAFLSTEFSKLGFQPLTQLF